MQPWRVLRRVAAISLAFPHLLVSSSCLTNVTVSEPARPASFRLGVSAANGPAISSCRCSAATTVYIKVIIKLAPEV